MYSLRIGKGRRPGTFARLPKAECRRAIACVLVHDHYLPHNFVLHYPERDVLGPGYDFTVPAYCLLVAETRMRAQPKAAELHSLLVSSLGLGLAVSECRPRDGQDSHAGT